MQVSTTIINGSEAIVGHGEEAALSQFYRAFNGRDMQLMEQCWLHTDAISMNNPLGGIRRGWEEIGNGYQKIFSGNAQVFVEFYDFAIHRSGDLFFANGRERGYFKTGGLELPLAIRTTRIFIQTGEGWKQIHHHGSIDNPSLLDSYQKAIINT